MAFPRCFSRLGLSVALSLPVVAAESKSEETKVGSRKLKPSQLPLYEDPEEIFR